MKRIEDFLSYLRECNVELWIEGDRLCCSVPKETLTIDLRNELARRKGEILTFFQEANLPAKKLPEKLPIISSNYQERYEAFPLNDIQQVYWIGRHEFFALGNISTHNYLEIECVNLDIKRLEHAWQRLIERHEMLRAIMRADGQQQILPQVPKYEIAVLDLRASSPQLVESQLASIRERLSHQVLAADKWPLFEIQGVQLEGGKVRICISFDALIADASSVAILSKELALLMQNPQQEFSPIEVSFRDYVLAEIAYRESPQYQSSWEYWHNRIPTLPPAPQLPLSKNILQVPQPKFVRRSSKLGADKWECLKAKARQFMVSTSVLLLAAFAEILTVWTPNPEFTINLTLYNRLPVHPQINEVVGDFTSLSLMAIDNRENETFAQRLRRVQQQLWLDLEHRDVSGTNVLRELRRHKGWTSEVLMPVVFTSTLTHDSEFNETFSMEWLGEVIYSISQTPQIYLDHQVSEINGELVFNWDAVEELFPPGLLDEMFTAYSNFLLRLVHSDEIWQTKTREFLPPQQLKLLSTVNETQTPVPESALLHSLFFAQALNQPDKVALVTTLISFTYEQLSQYALHLGHQLRLLGVQVNQLVAVVMAKGWEQIVAVLGILASGAAYVPIAAQLPKERLFYLLEETQVQVVLTQQRLARDLEWPDNVQLVCVDTLDMTGSQTQLEWVQKPSDLAYVIYTSGSTGLPKGVMIDHRGAVNTILDINQRFHVSSCDRVLALSSLSFDLSVYDIFGTLAAGGAIVVTDADQTKEPAHWIEMMQQHQVSIWNSVPALMQMLLNYTSGHSQILPSSLRLALLSGDWLPLALPDQLRGAVKDVQVVSLGGATEASIWSIIYPIAKVDPTWKSIPYGRPMANQQFYVLNHANEPCPVWVPGQLYIGGMGLALGYWRNQEKTNASFIIHPQTQQRLYKTGDLGRYLPSGDIEFLGREDFQVKVNGYRIELGEIEATLQQHPMVEDVVVSAIGESTKDKHLVAYVVLKPNSKQEPSEAYEPSQLDGVISDPIERIEFKLQQAGIKPIQPTQTTVELSKPEFSSALTHKYLQRQSYRQFLDAAISLEQLSLLLSCLLQMKLEGVPLPKYRYASVGNLYPVQAYVLIKPQRVQGIEPGIYYYHPVEHQLVLMTAVSEIDSSAYGGNQPVFENAAFSLFLMGELQAIAPMYGELAKDFCLLEAGYISQLLMETAPEYDIGLCPIGYLQLEKWRDVFALSTTQVLLHSFVGGGIASVQKSQWLHSPFASVSSSQSIEEQLRDWLRQKLPDYMIPSFVMILDALPFTASGKIDRTALPLPDTTGLKTQYIAPRTPTEEVLCTICASILGLEKVGIHDNLFDLGGDSVKATQIISRLGQAFGVDLPLRLLFAEPTIISIAGHIERIRSTSTELQSTSTTIMEDREDILL
jgi:amino acid adenylation domain-containing protein